MEIIKYFLFVFIKWKKLLFKDFCMHFILLF